MTSASVACVGWVERSETHHLSGNTNAMGFAPLNPSYAGYINGPGFFR